MPKNKSVLDANLILRLLLRDEPYQLKAVEDLVDRADSRSLEIADVTIMEVIFVLKSVYQTPKVGLIEALYSLLENEKFSVDQLIIGHALEIYEHSSISWIDAYILAFTKQGNYDRLYTFDQDLIRASNRKAMEPR